MPPARVGSGPRALLTSILLVYEGALSGIGGCRANPRTQTTCSAVGRSQVPRSASTPLIRRACRSVWFHPRLPTKFPNPPSGGLAAGDQARPLAATARTRLAVVTIASCRLRIVRGHRELELSLIAKWRLEEGKWLTPKQLPNSTGVRIVLAACSGSYLLIIGNGRGACREAPGQELSLRGPNVGQTYV